MKKIISFCVLLVMLLSLATPVFAYSYYGDSYGAIYDDTDFLAVDVCEDASEKLETMSQEYESQPEGEEESTIYIYDFAEILTKSQVRTLESRAVQLAETYGYGVYVAVVSDYKDYAYSIEGLCDVFFNEYCDENAIVLAMSMNERDYCLREYGSMAQSAVTDYSQQLLQNAFKDNFKNDDWFGGFEDYLDTADEIQAAAQAGKPLDEPLINRLLPAYGIGLIAAVIIAFIVCGVFKSQMKTAVKATSADTYVAPGGVDIQLREDRYTHTTRTRRKIETERSSSGGGGGSHSSSGKF